MCAAEPVPDLPLTDEAAARIRALDVRECYELLSTDTVGRVVYTDGALPAITPVNYAVNGHHVIFRTTPESRLGCAVSGQVVAFEVDQLDRSTRTGWSVVIMGVAQVLERGSSQLCAAALALAPWAGGERDLFLSITPGKVTGRVVGG